MIRINELKLDKMLLQKINSILSLLNEHENGGIITPEQCLLEIAKVVDDNIFLNLLNEKNNG